MMEILMTIGLVILGIIILIGIIRIWFAPYTDVPTLLIELFVLDWLGDCLEWVFSTYELRKLTSLMPYNIEFKYDKENEVYF